MTNDDLLTPLPVDIEHVLTSWGTLQRRAVQMEVCVRGMRAVVTLADRVSAQCTAWVLGEYMAHTPSPAQVVHSIWLGFKTTVLSLSRGGRMPSMACQLHALGSLLRRYGNAIKPAALHGVLGRILSMADPPLRDLLGEIPALCTLAELREVAGHWASVCTKYFSDADEAVMGTGEDYLAAWHMWNVSLLSDSVCITQATHEMVQACIVHVCRDFMTLETREQQLRFVQASICIWNPLFDASVWRSPRGVGKAFPRGQIGGVDALCGLGRLLQQVPEMLALGHNRAVRVLVGVAPTVVLDTASSHALAQAEVGALVIGERLASVFEACRLRSDWEVTSPLKPFVADSKVRQWLLAHEIVQGLVASLKAVPSQAASSMVMKALRFAVDRTPLTARCKQQLLAPMLDALWQCPLLTTFQKLVAVKEFVVGRSGNVLDDAYLLGLALNHFMVNFHPSMNDRFVAGCYALDMLLHVVRLLRVGDTVWNTVMLAVQGCSGSVELHLSYWAGFTVQTFLLGLSFPLDVLLDMVMPSTPRWPLWSLLAMVRFLSPEAKNGIVDDFLAMMAGQERRVTCRTAAIQMMFPLAASCIAAVPERAQVVMDAVQARIPRIRPWTACCAEAVVTLKVIAAPFVADGPCSVVCRAFISSVIRATLWRQSTLGKLCAGIL